MNNKGADQTAQMHRLVCTFVVRKQKSGFVTVSVLWLFLTVPWLDLQCVIVVFPDHTHLHFFLNYSKAHMLYCAISKQNNFSNLKSQGCLKCLQPSFGQIQLFPSEKMWLEDMKKF